MNLLHPHGLLLLAIKPFSLQPEMQPAMILLTPAAVGVWLLHGCSAEVMAAELLPDTLQENTGTFLMVTPVRSLARHLAAHFLDLFLSLKIIYCSSHFVK